MIKINNGAEINLSDKYFAEYVKNILSQHEDSCSLSESKKNIAVSGDETGLKLEVHIVVKINANIPNLSATIKDEIKSGLENDTEILVDDITIFVDGVE